MRTVWGALLVAVGLGAAGCGAVIRVDGIEVRQAQFERDAPSVRTLAAFAFSCPKEELHTTLLAVNQEKQPTQIGVAGCGKKGTYVAMYEAMNEYEYVLYNQSMAAR